MYPLYKEMIERETGLNVIGHFPYLKECSLESRHLGLITASEVVDLQQKINILAQQAAKTIDLHALLAIANSAPEIEYTPYPIEKLDPVTIAIAQDKAFCFYYQDSIELLESMGAVIKYFSPLQDKELPACDGIIFGGGYPEVYAQALTENTEIITSLQTAFDSGIPCIAECGGFMYLLDQMTDSKGDCHTMTGILKGEAFMTDKLSRFGYITLTSQNDNLLAKKGEQINAHEFHYSDSTLNGNAFIANKPTRDTSWSCIHADENLYAGYPHIHLWGNIRFAERFLNKCREYKLRES